MLRLLRTCHHHPRTRCRLPFASLRVVCRKGVHRVAAFRVLRMGVGRLAGMVNTGASSSSSTVIVITTVADSLDGSVALMVTVKPSRVACQHNTWVLHVAVSSESPLRDSPSWSRPTVTWPVIRSIWNRSASVPEWYPPPGSRSDGHCSHRWLQPGRRRRPPPWPRHPLLPSGAVRVTSSLPGSGPKSVGNAGALFPLGNALTGYMEVATTVFPSPSPSS